MAFNRVLRLGSQGTDVTEWQHFLIGQGFGVGVADGKFGPATEAATKAFQRKYKLGDDGTVGPRTFGQAMVLGFGGGVEDDAQPEDDTGGPNWPPPPDFLPLVSNADRQRIFGKFSWQPTPTPTNREAITITDQWPSENIVSVELPGLAKLAGARRGTANFHRLVAPHAVAMWQEWQDEGLGKLLLNWGGSWVPRLVRGGTTLSNHCFGSALDVNTTWNRLGAVPALRGEKGSVRELVQIANKHGFWWGGHFASRADGMHFEWGGRV